jgi:Ca-activated chloride channel homolog
MSTLFSFSQRMQRHTYVKNAAGFCLSLTLLASCATGPSPTSPDAPYPAASATAPPEVTPSGAPTATPEATATPAPEATSTPQASGTPTPLATPELSASGPFPSPSPQVSPSSSPEAIQNYRETFFQNYGTNPFVEASTDPLSTFAADIDTASYAVTRAYLQQNTLPPQAAVRPEEFVNAFRYDYPQPLSDTFAIHTDFAPSYFGDTYTKMLRIGIQGKEILDRNRKVAKLTFVVDVSGSMNAENRLGLVKQSLLLLLSQLRATDEVALVIYGSSARAVLTHTPVSEISRIQTAINNLRPEGSTNVEAGLLLAYAEANRAFDGAAINRVILCSDGVANVGATGPEAILEQVQAEGTKGISLSTLGFGMNGFNDVLMEQLANRGDGQYAYIDTLNEARKLFVEQLTSTLQLIARNVKIQVAFDPETVTQYRLIGYENRDVADEDFRNDAVDAGEVGSNHSVTALYEVRLTPEALPESKVATVFIRYEDVDAEGLVKEQQKAILGSELKAFSNSSPSFQLSVAAAEFAEILRGSIFAQDSQLGEVQQLLSRIQGKAPQAQELNELISLLTQAQNVLSPQPAKNVSTLLQESKNPRQLMDWNTFLLKQLGGLPPGA